AAAGVIDAFRSALVNSLAAGDPDQVRQALLDQLGPNGLAVLRDQDGDGSVDLADIPLLSDATTVSYDIHLRSDASATSSFHLRLPGLPLQLGATGTAQLAVGFDGEMTFGFTGTGGNDPKPFVTFGP